MLEAGARATRHVWRGITGRASIYTSFALGVGGLAHSVFLFFFFLRIGRPPISPLFPSTTLSRSRSRSGRVRIEGRPGQEAHWLPPLGSPVRARRAAAACRRGGRARSAGAPRPRRRRSVSADRKSTRLNSSHLVISYAVFCLKKKK